MYTLTSLIEIMALVLAAFFLKNEKQNWWVYFTWYLLLITMIEISAYIMYFVFGEINHWLYNILLPFTTCFVSFVLYKCLRSFTNKRWWFIAGLLMFSGIYLFESFNAGFKLYSSQASNFISVFFIVTSLLYFYYLLKQEGYINLLQYPPFWIVTGIFIFYFGRIGCNFFFDYLVEMNKDQLRPIRYIIFLVLNFILYGCWSYGFLWKYRARTLMTSNSQ